MDDVVDFGTHEDANLPQDGGNQAGPGPVESGHDERLAAAARQARAHGRFTMNPLFTNALIGVPEALIRDPASSNARSE
jgi:hypothetical protein